MEPKTDTPLSQRRLKQVWFILGAGSVLLVMLLVTTILRPREGYDSLEELVADLDAAIAANDHERVKQLCHEPPRVSLQRINRQHAKLSYTTLLNEDLGWKSTDAWKLGGHGPRFGHIHVDFVKQLDGRWYLKRIRECK